MKELLEQAESLQNLLVSQATGGPGDNSEYLRSRQVLLAQPALEPYVPRFVRTCRDPSQCWQFIKHEYGTYRARREFLWEEFRPLLEILERGGPLRGSVPCATALATPMEEGRQGLSRPHATPSWL